MSSSTDFLLQETCLCIMSYLHTKTASMYGRSEEWNRCADYISERVDVVNEYLRESDKIANASPVKSNGGQKA